MEQYDVILEHLLEDFERQAGCLVDDASDTAIKFKVIASEFKLLFDKLDYYSRQIFPNTADGAFLEKHGAIRGITKKLATPAKGKAIFSCKTAPTADLPIPAGTLCTSSKGSGLMFQTTADAVVKKNTTYAVIEVVAVDAGSHTNLAPHYLDILVSPIIGITSVDNTEKLAGGADAENDDMFRQRVIESFNKISNGANLGYYEQFAKSRGEVWYAKAAYVSGTPNRIDLYVENFTRTISDSVISSLQQEIQSARELGIQLEVKRPTIKPIHAQVVLRVDNLANKYPYANAADDLIHNVTLGLSIGQRWSPSFVASKVLTLPGITDVTFTAPAAPVEVAAGEICMINSLNISVTA